MLRFAVLSLIAVVAVALLPAAPAAAAPTLNRRTIQNGLTHPWDVAFAPNGAMLVTERTGRIRVFKSGADNAPLLSTKHVAGIRAEGEAGVMGIDVARRNGVTLVFVCMSRQDLGAWRNQVLRYRFNGRRLYFDRYVIRKGIRANTFHNGCAVEVGPDRNLYIGTGDAGDLSLPQNRRSLNGKVLRVKFNGDPAGGNPFGTRVFTMGHRNVQGITFHPGTGRAYSLEHGPDRNDEMNFLVGGGNYGWPCYTGNRRPYANLSVCRSADSYRRPAWASGPSTIATSGAAFVWGRPWGSWRRDIFVSTLKEQDVRRFVLSDSRRRADQRSVLFNGVYGRLRGAVFRPRNRQLYLTTSNGGGTDRIIRIRASS